MITATQYLDAFYELILDYPIPLLPSQQQELLSVQVAFMQKVYEDGWNAGMEDAEQKLKDNN